MSKSVIFRKASIRGYSSKATKSTIAIVKKVLFRALFNDQLALDLDVESPSPDYWGVDLKLEMEKASLLFRPTAISATLEIDVREVTKFTVRRSDDGPVWISFEALMTNSSLALAEFYDSYGEAPGELKITVAGEQTSINNTSVSISVSGSAPVQTTVQNIEDATAKLLKKDEVERARSIRNKAASDGNPFDGGKETTQ